MPMPRSEAAEPPAASKLTKAPGCASKAAMSNVRRLKVEVEGTIPSSETPTWYKFGAEIQRCHCSPKHRAKHL